MFAVPQDVFTEPSEVDHDTLSNLGPLRPMAGIWQSDKGLDVHPIANGSRIRAFVDWIELQPIDPQTNGPQLFYGLRYHQHIVKPGDVKTFHDQVGYWLWEPATGTIIQTVAIPRGQVAMAIGKASRYATEFELVAARSSTTNGICSNAFLEDAFRTVEYRIKVTVNADGSCSYDEDTTLIIQGKSEPFQHTDKNRFVKTGEPVPNPLARNLAFSNERSRFKGVSPA